MMENEEVLINITRDPICVIKAFSGETAWSCACPRRLISSSDESAETGLKIDVNGVD